MKSQPLIDAHVHLYPDADTAALAKDSYAIWEYGDDPGVCFDAAVGVIEEVGDRFADRGFDHAVVLQLFDVAAERNRIMKDSELTAGKHSLAEAEVDALLVEHLLAANRWAVHAASGHPILVAYIGIDPCLLPPRIVTPHLAAMAGLGARGIKLHPVSQGFEPRDPRLDPVYETCCELDLVVLSHSGPGHRHGATARPSDFAAVLERWPNLRLVLAHLGGAAYEEAVELANDFPQVNFDLSEIIEWVGAPNAPSVERLVQVVQDIGVDRVMLGSDFPWYDPSATADKVSSLPGLSSQEKAALLGGSAVDILRLERTTA
ncbi:MAG TPA: amidohydrolase family protein [Acidimicrobiales bacterium]|nr:amidohydrolase family protein [Acidimicrobiales bacterium]